MVNSSAFFKIITIKEICVWAKCLTDAFHQISALTIQNSLSFIAISFVFLPIFSENTVRIGLEEEGRCAASMLFVFYLKIHYSCHPNEAIYNIFWELLLSIVLRVCEEKASFSVPFLIIMSSSYVVWNVWQIWYNTFNIFSIIWISLVLFSFFWWREMVIWVASITSRNYSAPP